MTLCIQTRRALRPAFALVLAAIAFFLAMAGDALAYGVYRYEGSVTEIVVMGTSGADRVTTQTSSSSVVFHGATARTGCSAVPEGARCSLDDVDKVRAHLGGGDDYLSVSFDIRLEVNGGAGNDLLGGSDSADLIYGGTGQDRILGDAGDDLIIAGVGHGDDPDGDDTLEGGSGNDWLTAGLGRDRLIAGAGVDVLYGGRDPEFFSTRDGGYDEIIPGGGGPDLISRDPSDKIYR